MTDTSEISKWHERDHAIYFSITSDGATGEEWIERMESNDFPVNVYAKQLLRSTNFKPTDGVTIEVAVLRGMLFSDNDCITRNIRAEADRRKLTNPNAEVVCLICEKFSNEELKAMGPRWIVAMHEPINDSGGIPRLLGADLGGDAQWLSTYSSDPGSGWGREFGFAFVAS